MIKRDEQIVSTRFKNEIEWLTYLRKLKIFGAPRRAPPSPLAPVIYILFNRFVNYDLSFNLFRKDRKNH